MFFNYIIQNPPYAGSMHLNFLKKGIELAKKANGKMTIIEPSTFLINLRENGKAKTLYPEIKTLLNKHVYKIIIENMNNDFHISLYVPIVILYIDFSTIYDDILFYCCGEYSRVTSLNDCNLIGNYNTIQNIFKKIQSYKDVMQNHIYNNQKILDNNYFQCYLELCAVHPVAYSSIRKIAANNNERYIKLPFGEFYKLYTDIFCHNQYNISKDIPKSIARGGSTTTNKKFTNKNAPCLIDTKEHLLNWRYFIFNNKLPLFISLCLTIDQHNNCKNYIPWLIDKKYSDSEIYKLFNFTTEEINLINKTINKFNRYSLWFIRYRNGK